MTVHKQPNAQPSQENDDHTSVGELRAAVRAFVAARDWEQFHTPKHLAMSIAIEAAEIMEHVQWLNAEEAHALARNSAQRAEIANELADVLIYCLSFANSADIDISTAVRTKLARNEGRFPVDEISGRLP